MKKKLLALFFMLLIIPFSVNAQNYSIENLKKLSSIWGKCYLFHPSVVSQNNQLNWEKQLVEFLPTLKRKITNDQFITSINTKLLNSLNDPLTRLSSNKYKTKSYTKLSFPKSFDYIKLEEQQIRNTSNFIEFYNVLLKKDNEKPLIIDCRINSTASIDYHTYNFFHYVLALFVNKEINLCNKIVREHFGWDEYNDRWAYEQRWKVTMEDRQQINNGVIMSINNYSHEFAKYNPQISFQKLKYINRPLYFIFNNTFLATYQNELLSIKLNRKNTYLFFEKTGKIEGTISNIKLFKEKGMDFSLNSAVFVNQNQVLKSFDFVSDKIKENDILYFKRDTQLKTRLFNYTLKPKKYQSKSKLLSLEDKILGIFKIHTIIKNFYPYIQNCKVNWDKTLEGYLKMAQNIKTNKEYFELIQRMMAGLSDSHVSTFHPSILDFSKIFCVPINFEYIQNKLIITYVDKSLKSYLKLGDEIIAINNQRIVKILKQQSEKISYSNNQGLYASVFTPGNFVGAKQSDFKLKIKRKAKTNNLTLKRTTHFYQFYQSIDKRVAKKVYKNNVGYINMAKMYESELLISNLIEMKDTKALILDFRNSYPTHNFYKFLSMLSKNSYYGRISSEKIVSLFNKSKTENKFLIKPSKLFQYTKPIYVLIDKSVVSRPEDICIALKSLSQVKFIGEQTQGTNGEVAKIYLPGGGETSFTCQKILFPNKQNFKGIGILPDIKVLKTQKGIEEGKDEILEEALRKIN